MLPNVLPVEDTEVSQTLEKSLHEAGHHASSPTPRSTEDRDDRQGREDHRREAKGAEKRSRPTSASSPSASRRAARRQLKLEAHRSRLHQDRRPLRDQRAGHLRRRRHHRAAVARARRELRGHAGASKGMFVPGHKPKKVTHLPRLHLLPAAGRQRRPHRTRREGKGPRSSRSASSRSWPAARPSPSARPKAL